jgi:hypothetical protein
MLGTRPIDSPFCLHRDAAPWTGTPLSSLTLDGRQIRGFSLRENAHVRGANGHVQRKPRLKTLNGVTWTGVIRRCGFCFAAAPIRPIQRLDTPLTASVIAALIGLVLLGLGLMLFAWLLARWIRRTTRPADVVRPKGPLGPSDWEPQPWVPSEEGDAGSGWDEGSDE